MLSYFSRSPTSSSPEYNKGRHQVLEVDNEDNSLEDQTVKDTFQDAPPWISALYNEMKSARKEMAQVKTIRDELIQVRSILNDFLNFNPISTGGGVFHPRPSKWLRTPQRNKLAP